MFGLIESTDNELPSIRRENREKECEFLSSCNFLYIRSVQIHAKNSRCVIARGRENNAFPIGIPSDLQGKRTIFNDLFCLSPISIGDPDGIVIGFTASKYNSSAVGRPVRVGAFNDRCGVVSVSIYDINLACLTLEGGEGYLLAVGRPL